MTKLHMTNTPTFIHLCIGKLTVPRSRPTRDGEGCRRRGAENTGEAQDMPVNTVCYWSVRMYLQHPPPRILLIFFPGHSNPRAARMSVCGSFLSSTPPHFPPRIPLPIVHLVKASHSTRRVALLHHPPRACTQSFRIPFFHGGRGGMGRQMGHDDFGANAHSRRCLLRAFRNALRTRGSGFVGRTPNQKFPGC